jgi:hypothetical protein
LERVCFGVFESNVLLNHKKDEGKKKGRCLFAVCQLENFRCRPAMAARVARTPLEQRIYFVLLLERLTAVCGDEMTLQWKDQVVVMTGA